MSNNKTFAFKLAEKKQVSNKPDCNEKWKARDGISLAGCTTDSVFAGEYRWPSQNGRRDSGMYC